MCCSCLVPIPLNFKVLRLNVRGASDNVAEDKLSECDSLFCVLEGIDFLALSKWVTVTLCHLFPSAGALLEGVRGMRLQPRKFDRGLRCTPPQSES